MEEIKNESEFEKLQENQMLGSVPKMISSHIVFEGRENILFCEDNVKLDHCNILFGGDNSIIFLSANKNNYKLKCSIYNNSVLFFDENNYLNGIIGIIISEETNVLVGKDNLWSFDVWLRTADPHLIYDIESKRRINFSKSILIGDHVWVGQDVMILKGTQIGSGSIIAAKACVGGGTMPSNTIFGGVPAKQIKDGIFWKGNCVHKWMKAQTDAAEYDMSEDFVYSKMDEKNELEWYDRELAGTKNASDKMNILQSIRLNRTKDRFAI